MASSSPAAAAAASLIFFPTAAPPFDPYGLVASFTEKGVLGFASWLTIHLTFGLLLYLSGSFAFDVAHVIWHRFMRSKSQLLRSIGYMHAVHHYYFNRQLVFNERYLKENLTLEIIPEFLLQISGMILPFLYVSPLIHLNVLLVLLTIMVVRLIWFLYFGGKDPNHLPYKHVPVCKSWLLVGPEFHALHHVFPDNYFSSFWKVTDWVCGSAYAIRGRRVVLTGASGAFGAPLKELLEGPEGAKSVITATFGKDWNYDDYSFFEKTLKDTDILILCHGSKVDNAMKANCESFVRIIEIYRRLRTNTLIPPEVWAMGSEIEFHPAWGNADLQVYLESKRAFMEYARWYYDRTDLFYRHIVPASFSSRMGPGLISGATAVWMAMGFIRAGFQYIPVSYTTLAFLHYFKFVYFVRPKNPATLAPSK